MERLLVPNDGVTGVDVTTERGTIKYNADKSGAINVDNPNHARQMIAEGFTKAMRWLWIHQRIQKVFMSKVWCR